MLFNQTNNNSNSNTSVNYKATQCHSILQKYFQHQDFRSNQLEIILNTLNGGDSLVVMATGMGKSLCYQIPPIFAKKPAIIVSPLISLIQNQIEALRAKGISAIGFTTHSSTTAYDYKEAFENNTYSVIYITPEGVDSKLTYLKTLQSKHGIACIGIDESHCISEWGFDFRPAYKQLGTLRDTFPNTPILALTATATKSVRDDIVRLLKLGQNQNNSLQRFISSFNRSNLTYKLKQKQGMVIDLMSVPALRTFYTQGSTIVYTSTQKAAAEIAQLLCAKGIRAGAYHGGMRSDIRRNNQQKFEHNELQCIVATIAFGMGIDKPDIRHVIHYGMPDSLEAYYQHTGRAGRDGQPSQCILFWTKADFSKSDWRATKSTSMIHQNLILKQTQKMKQFTYSNECRVKFILRHFGEEFNECIHRCDTCIERHKENGNNNNNKKANVANDYTAQTKTLILACQDSGQRFGMNTLIHLTHGNKGKTKKVINAQSKRAWNKLSHYSVPWITALSRKAVELGLLAEEWINNSGNGNTFRRGYKRIYITDDGYKVLRGQCRVPAWVPDKDMFEAEREAERKKERAALLQAQWSEKKSNNNSNNRTRTKPSKGWMFKGSNNRKRSFTEISDQSMDLNSGMKKRKILNESGINQAIIVPQRADCVELNQGPTMPQITNESNMFYEAYCSGEGLDCIAKRLTVERAKVEKCLANMVMNGYKMDWNGLGFDSHQIRACFEVFAKIGIKPNYNSIRGENQTLFGKMRDSQIDLLSARYIIDNFNKPKSKKHGAKWSVENDCELWTQREECILAIAKRCERSVGSIMGRLNQLRDVNSKNHIRLSGFVGEFGRERIECLGNHSLCDGSEEEMEDKDWNVCEDLCLFENRDCCIDLLRKHFGVKFKPISNRLIDLSGADFGARLEMLKYQQSGKSDQSNDCSVAQEMKNINVSIEINKGAIQELIGASKSGIGCDVLVKHFNINCNDGQQKLKQILEDMMSGFEIYQKDNKYFSF